jgi:hypothetical protein
MHHSFKNFTDMLHPKYERLMEMQPCTAPLPPHVKGSGVYMFSEDGVHLYVGRTRNVRTRYGQHCRPSSKHNNAPFAFKLAREETGFLKSTYRPGDTTRIGLLTNEAFSASFANALRRIGQMEFRFVEEADPTRQCLLELYVSIVMRTPYNDFDTH